MAVKSPLRGLAQVNVPAQLFPVTLEMLRDPEVCGRVGLHGQSTCAEIRKTLASAHFQQMIGCFWC